MKYLFFLITVLNFQNTFGQQFKILEKSDLNLESQNAKFIFISDETPLDKGAFVATFRVEGNFKYMFPLYYQIKNKAQKFGANSFKFRSFRKLEKEKFELIIETYFNDERFFEANSLNLPHDKIFIFGKPSLDNKTQTFKINGDNKEVTSGKYLEIILSEELNISKGGFAGSNITIVPNSYKSSTFLIVSGAGISGANFGSSSIGINFKSAGLEQLENDLGLLMRNLYEKN